MDYEITLHELEEADELCHGNWIEIQHKNGYIKRLQFILNKMVFFVSMRHLPFIMWTMCAEAMYRQLSPCYLTLIL
jgi:hypothetical protein